MADKNNITLNKCQYTGKYACPIDGTLLINHEDSWNTYYGTCPACGQEYSRYDVDKLEQVGKDIIEEARAEIKRINKLKPKLEKLIELFEKHHPAKSSS